MPFYYDVNRSETSNGSAGTSSTHFWVKTAANQDSCAIKGMYVAGRFGTAGGAQFRLSHNTGTTASGGTAQTPAPRNLRGNPAAQSVWANDATAITAGTTLVQRVSVGFAQTGGMGGWVALEPSAAIVMMPNATNPVDVEFTSVASAASVTFDATIEFSEGT
jgi:hypothetical protein